MKTEGFLFKIICMGLVLVLLTNCTIYKPVQGYPHDVDTKKTIVLHKDELQFVLENPQIKQDTIFARVRSFTGAVVKKDNMIIVLKPEMELSRTQDGTTCIPFNAIDHIRYYEKDIQRSNNAIIIGVSVGILTGLFAYLIYVVIAIDKAYDDIIDGV